MQKLEIYLADGRMEIDNNLAEHTIRLTAIGKKNWLFVGEGDAVQRSAVIYTVIETCRRPEPNPYQYLQAVLSRLPNMPKDQSRKSFPPRGPKHNGRCNPQYNRQSYYL